MTGAVINGFCASGFDPCRDAFAATFAEELNIGAGFAAFRQGEPLVDLVGGYADSERSAPFTDASLVHVWSVTKALTALVIGDLLDENTLLLDTPIASVWPEFGVGGKEIATLAHILAHQAGAPGTRRPMTDADLINHTPYAEALAAEPAMWTPGEQAAYHPISGGHILNETVKRCAGETIGALFASKIAAPLDLSVYIGLPAAEDSRAVETIGADGLMEERADRAARFPKAKDAILNPPLSPLQANTRAWRAAETPAGNAFATASDLARLFSQLTRVVSAQTLWDMTKERVNGPDYLVESPLRLSAGFMLNDDTPLLGPCRDAFGHTGWGGAFVYFDPQADIAVAFAPNYMLPEGERLTRRRTLLLDALYAAI